MSGSKERKSMLDQENAADGVGLLISILVRYPEVATINYDAGNQVLKFNFIFRHSLPGEVREGFQKILLESIAVFHSLEGYEPLVSYLDYNEGEGLAMLEVHRDVQTLRREEIALIVELVRENLAEYLVLDGEAHLFEEDLLIQEEIIDYLLDNMRGGRAQRALFAFREEGRVLVFNK
ncbi:hypothetical protein [Desulfurispora thermophila]|uniref:hypothetical protein n=1 Tax=Desulfurispora thermophila TaxID=265470 RepID=UPI000381B192|nr:hypothetical protein [Desulfurispora thermophila]